ncbi:unnamed protein product [Porites lobata]|uniref:Uncharacterized protein n=1 Tax=Porites lobata TaxID=104759 RepID=A0ABN8RH05_9CNID|nr:unnamed protein product [Porites lobata]
MQESGESYDHYQKALRQLVERCELLHEKNLSLEKTDEICRSQKTCMVQQMRVVGDASLSVADAGNVNAVSKKPKRGKRRHSHGSRNANA